MAQLRPIPLASLEGKSVLVTGAGTGIGAELARQLAAHGAKVFAGVHRVGGVEDLPGEAIVFPLDVTSDADADAGLARVRRETGRLDTLVNNAGVIAPIGRMDSISSDALGAAFAVNVVGAHRMSVRALPLLQASGGRIVNAGTGAATTALEGWTAYCASKAGLLMLTRMMALEFAPAVKAFFLCIPPTDTSMQTSIRASGLNVVSQIPREDLTPCAVPASCLAWLCSGAGDGLGEFVLDVRREPFASMMAATD